MSNHSTFSDHRNIPVYRTFYKPAGLLQPNSLSCKLSPVSRHMKCMCDFRHNDVLYKQSEADHHQQLLLIHAKKQFDQVKLPVWLVCPAGGD